MEWRRSGWASLVVVSSSWDGVVRAKTLSNCSGTATPYDNGSPDGMVKPGICLIFSKGRSDFISTLLLHSNFANDLCT